MMDKGYHDCEIIANSDEKGPEKVNFTYPWNFLLTSTSNNKVGCDSYRALSRAR